MLALASPHAFEKAHDLRHPFDGFEFCSQRQRFAVNKMAAMGSSCGGFLSIEVGIREVDEQIWLVSFMH